MTENILLIATVIAGAAFFVAGDLFCAAIGRGCRKRRDRRRVAAAVRAVERRWGWR